MINKTGSAKWSGGLKDGKGRVSTESGALKDLPYGFNTRFEGEPGTNPEELIGAAHAGWRGALTGVLDATIAVMEQFGADRDRIHVALGPMIRQGNYEVGPEFVQTFCEQDPANSRFFQDAEREGHALFDLPGYIAARLRRAGISRIDDIGLCTYAEPDRFYSYRRSVHRGEPDYGRHINAIVLRD